MLFCTDTHTIHESSNAFLFNKISFTKHLIIPTITNKWISTELNQNNTNFISAANTEQWINNRCHTIVVSKMLIQLYIYWLWVNYINLLLYSVSLRDFPSPEPGVFGISVGDLTSRSALLSLTLLSACKIFKIRILFNFT